MTENAFTMAEGEQKLLCDGSEQCDLPGSLSDVKKLVGNSEPVNSLRPRSSTYSSTVKRERERKERGQTPKVVVEETPRNGGRRAGVAS